MHKFALIILMALIPSLAVAQERAKPTIIMFSADWCGPCKKFKNNLKVEQKLIRFIDETFDKIYVVDQDTDSGKKMMRDYNLGPIVPQFVIGYVQENGRMRVAGNVAGYSGIDDFIRKVSELAEEAVR